MSGLFSYKTSNRGKRDKDNIYIYTFKVLYINTSILKDIKRTNDIAKTPKFLWWRCYVLSHAWINRRWNTTAWLMHEKVIVQHYVSYLKILRVSQILYPRNFHCGFSITRAKIEDEKYSKYGGGLFIAIEWVLRTTSLKWIKPWAWWLEINWVEYIYSLNISCTE